MQRYWRIKFLIFFAIECTAFAALGPKLAGEWATFFLSNQSKTIFFFYCISFDLIYFLNIFLNEKKTIFVDAGKYSHDVDSGHLFVPRRVHLNGTHLSYNVTHFHGHDNVNEIDSGHPAVHYHIDMPDHTMHVELK